MVLNDKNSKQTALPLLIKRRGDAVKKDNSCVEVEHLDIALFTPNVSKSVVWILVFWTYALRKRRSDAEQIIVLSFLRFHCAMLFNPLIFCLYLPRAKHGNISLLLISVHLSFMLIEISVLLCYLIHLLVNNHFMT